MEKKSKNFCRRSISIPVELDELIKKKYKLSEHIYINDMIIELIELGLLKEINNDEIKNQNLEIISKLDQLISLVSNGF